MPWLLLFALFSFSSLSYSAEEFPLYPGDVHEVSLSDFGGTQFIRVDLSGDNEKDRLAFRNAIENACADSGFIRGASQVHLNLMSKKSLSVSFQCY